MTPRQAVRPGAHRAVPVDASWLNPDEIEP